MRQGWRPHPVRRSGIEYRPDSLSLPAWRITYSSQPMGEAIEDFQSVLPIPAHREGALPTESQTEGMPHFP